MRCGLFGKLQTKRDFIAIATPRQFLSVWEQWTQAAVSASRTALGDKWQETYLIAPIWRFWLGPDIAGATAAGAIMPSVDGVGRYYPLSVFALADDGYFIPPPELDPQESWYEALEGFLFSTLDSAYSFGHAASDLEALPAPDATRTGVASDASRRLSPHAVLISSSASIDAQFASARMSHPDCAYRVASFWWTTGGEGFDRAAIFAHRLPDPYIYAGMLSGRFEPIETG
jgi:type VI secretion system protein ImpM